MDLIEQLGGYEKARARQQELSKMAADPRLLFVVNIIKEIGEIKLSLLEYRRSHKIYEEGDKVVCWVTGRVGLIDCFIGDYFCMVKIKNDVGGFTFIKNNMEAIKHATDEEIEANRRPDQQ